MTWNQQLSCGGWGWEMAMDVDFCYFYVYNQLSISIWGTWEIRFRKRETHWILGLPCITHCCSSLPTNPGAADKDLDPIFQTWSISLIFQGKSKLISQTSLKIIVRLSVLILNRLSSEPSPTPTYVPVLSSTAATSHTQPWRVQHMASPNCDDILVTLV